MRVLFVSPYVPSRIRVRPYEWIKALAGLGCHVHLVALRAGARSAFEVGLHVWGGSLGFHEQRFALVEAVSHLERLEGEGRVMQVEPKRWAPM